MFAKEERLMEEAIMALEEQFISLQPAQATPGAAMNTMGCKFVAHTQQGCWIE